MEALPAGSEILMDGKRLGYGRYRGTHPAGEGKSLIEVRAAGYASERKEVVLNRNTAIKVLLRKPPAEPTIVPPPAGSEVKPADAPSSAPARPAARAADKHVQGRSTKSSARARPAARGDGAAPAPVPSDTAPPGCDPPYTFSADGVKTYKPQCF